MKKKLIILAGGLIVTALSLVFFTDKPLTAREELILRNVEAIAGAEANNGPFEKLVYHDDCKIYEGPPYWDGMPYILGDLYVCIEASPLNGGYIGCTWRCYPKKQ